MDANSSSSPAPIRRDRQSRWLAIVSRSRRGFGPALARAGLTGLAGLYRLGLVVADLRWRRRDAARRAPCPVVSVGNLTVGGTGKTPMVAYLANLLVAEGYRPLIVSRGYGAEAGAMNEEARELADACPDVPQVQRPDRLQAIRDWSASEPCDVAILDDGFQHRRLARDLDIVLIDALRPFGYGHVLPRGLLREPPAALARADLVVITHADLLGADALAGLRQALTEHLMPDVRARRLPGSAAGPLPPPVPSPTPTPSSRRSTDSAPTWSGWMRSRTTMRTPQTTLPVSPTLPPPPAPTSL